MGNENAYEQLNKAFLEFSLNSEIYLNKIGKPINLLEKDIKELITKVIPDILYKIYDPNYYKIKGSIGNGLVTKSPWIAVMKNNITQTTQKGVFILFIFNKDLKSVYIGISQSIAPRSYLGIQKNIKELKEIREMIKKNLQLDLPYMNYDLDEIDIANKVYQESLIYAYPWDYKTVECKNQIMQSYTSAYLKLILQFRNLLSKGNLSK